MLRAMLLLFSCAPSDAVPTTNTPNHRQLEPQAQPASSIQFGEDLGAAYDPTLPLVGPTLPYVWSQSSRAQLPVSACAPLAAAVDRHTIWFKGYDDVDHSRGPLPSSMRMTRTTSTMLAAARDGYFARENANATHTNQQTAELAFVQQLETRLCATSGQSEDEFTEILHSMLEEVRVHINRHVHSAFWVKVRRDHCSPLTHHTSSHTQT